MLLGNCTKSHSFLKFVNQISSNVVLVKGAFDNKTIASTANAREEIPLNTIIKQGDFTIACCNGYTVVPKSDPLSLLTLARQLDVDIVLWGGTHNVEAYTLEDKFFINPGTCTGAFSTDWPQQELDTENVAEQKDPEAAPKNENTEGSPESDSDNDFDESDANGSCIPSFCLLDIQGSVCTLYIYTYIDGEVKVDKVVYNKK